MNNELPDDIELLKAMLRRQQSRLRQYACQVAGYEQEIERLKAQLDRLRRMLFGQSSEKKRHKLENQIRQAEKRQSELENRLNTARNLLEKVSKTLQSKPFNFFTKGDPKSLLALLQHERPQVIALIMAYMDPQQAAQILEQLPNEKRIPVLEGMANMSRVSPEAIAIVEEEMKRKFATIITSEDNMNLGGIDYVADVMNHVDRGNEKQIFDEMDKDNPELSKSIRDKMFMFENIIDMDPRSVQRFIRDCDSKDIVYALKTASEDMKNVFFANMSKRMAETVKGDLEITTNVRLKEVEEAQQRIVNLIRKLEDAGEVIINKGGDDDNIVV